MTQTTLWRAFRVVVVRLRFVGLVLLAAAIAANLDELSTLARDIVVNAHAHSVQTRAARYVCPMHPEVVSDEPGVCPSCRMRLSRQEASAAEYVCPMHPDAVRSEPGKCPACGMPLRKREEDGEASLALTSARARLASIAFTTVRRQSLEREVTAVASVEFDERRVVRLTTPLRAQVSAVRVAAPGALVRRGESVATLAIRDLYQLGRDLQRTTDEADATLVLARQRLLQLGLSKAQVDRLHAGRDPIAVELLSPFDGILVSRTAVVGDQVPEMASLATVAEISKLWLVARLPEEDALLGARGTEVEAELVAAPGLTIRGRITWVDSAVDAASRTLAVRAEIDNPGGVLRPGMTGRVRLKVPVGSPDDPPLVVPAAAVVDNGRERIVWREDEEGIMEAERVTVGARAGHLYAISQGLKEGDRIVSEGAFLLSADQLLKRGGTMQMGATSRSGAEVH